MTPSSSSIYHQPDIPNSLDSFEGLIEPWTPVKPAGDATPAKQKSKREGAFERLGVLLPGMVLASAAAALGTYGSDWIGTAILRMDKSPISGLMLAILAGLAVRNAVGLPAVYMEGVKFCLAFMLRFGVAILGLRLSLLAVGKIGLLALPVVLGCVLTALVLATWIGRRLGLSRSLASLIAVGTGICGVSAIVATASAVEAGEDEISYAAATITLFGMLAMFVYPFLAHLLFGERADLAGYFLGAAIHDTAQVAGAGLMYTQQFPVVAGLDPEVALNIAVVTKLMRNLCLILAVPIMAYLYHRAKHDGKGGPTLNWRRAIPMFIVAFIALTVVRTVGDAVFPVSVIDADGAARPSAWTRLMGLSQTVASAALALSMAAVGLNTDLRRLAHQGFRPLATGLIAALTVGAVSFVLILISSRILIPTH